MNEGALILIVEDEAVTARHISLTLQQYGYRIAGIVDSANALFPAIERLKPDLVMMDIHLGRQGAVIELAESMLRSYDLPVVFLSANSDCETMIRAKRTEPSGFIIMPFQDVELYSAIETALCKHDVERRLKYVHKLLFQTLSTLEEGVATVDSDGLIQNANPAVARILLNESIDITGRDMLGLLRRDPDLELRCPVEISVLPLIDAAGLHGGQVYVFRNLRERLEAQMARKALDAIVESSEDAVISIDLRGLVRTWNPGANRLFGLTAGQIIGTSLSSLIPPFQPDQVSLNLEEVRRSGKAINFEGIFRRTNGELLDLSLTLSPIIGSAGRVGEITVIARDISARKSLERTVLDVSEKERMRIGQDLHDSLGQYLTGILLKVRSLEKTGADSAELGKLTGMLQSAIGQTRTIARNLVPLSLDTIGLAGALRELADYVQGTQGVPTELTIEAIQLPTNLAIQLFRIAQEAVSNACRHSRTPRLDITLRKDVAELVLTVRDWGAGIVADRVEGLGLKIMKYRASMLGAHLEVFAHPDGGTQVTCRVPLSDG